MEAIHPELGVCGLSCRLCPGYVMTTKSRCPGCKTDNRFVGPCKLLHCRVRRENNYEFCWDCPNSETCEKWSSHREYGKQYDSFKCYQTLEKDIEFVQTKGLEAFIEDQKERERLLHELLDEFNEGRSKSYFCLAATVLEISDLKTALERGRAGSSELDIKAKAKLMHSLLDDFASKKGIELKLRKKEATG